VWFPQAAVDGKSKISTKAASANCHPNGVCDGWNWGKDCSGHSEPVPTPAPVGPVPTPPPPSPKRWKLVWSDGFDDCPNDQPNKANWGYEHGYVRNHEEQWYQEDNAECVNGNLVITARREQPAEDESFAYTSSSLTSEGKREFKKGRWVMRAKIPVDKGVWPAFWIRGANTKMEWPSDGEIDIMEYYRGSVLANFAYGDENNQAVWNEKKFAVDQQWADQFHVWTFEWDDEEMRILVDDEQINSQKVASADGTGHANPWREFPVYMIVNVAIGGANGGDASGTQFPVQYLVDNISYYEQIPDTLLVVA